jgi:hypothetical protein
VLENCAEQIIFCLPVNPDNVKEIQVWCSSQQVQSREI